LKIADCFVPRNDVVCFAAKAVRNDGEAIIVYLICDVRPLTANH